MTKFKVVLILKPDGHEVLDGEFTAEEAWAKVEEIDVEERPDVLAALLVEVLILEEMELRTLN